MPFRQIKTLQLLTFLIEMWRRPTGASDENEPGKPGDTHKLLLRDFVRSNRRLLAEIARVPMVSWFHGFPPAKVAEYRSSQGLTL